MENYKKYLPSKKFTSLILIVIIFIALFFTIKGIMSLFSKNNESGLGNIQVVGTVEEKMEEDSNDNGIADWEEYLYGLNPNKNGPENKEKILSKKKELIEKGEIVITDDSGAITDNEILSRQFFATVVSLLQDGEINEESIKSVSDAVGQSIDTTPLPDIYNKNDLKITKNSTKVNDDYLTAFALLVIEYEDNDMGKELTLISQVMFIS
jgi:hypothetical protein